MFNIDFSFWRADQMPVYIQDLIGYDTDTVTIKGGSRRYLWVRLLEWGIEITYTSATERQEGIQANGLNAFAQTAAPPTDT